MSLVLYLKRLYSLDTLDTRFTVSSSAPVAKTSTQHGVEVEHPALSAAGQPAKRDDQALPVGASPSKWHTPEYIFYGIVIAFALPKMFLVAINVSKETDSQYPKFAPLLSRGWIFGRKVDNSDDQYSNFRDNIPYMAILLVLHPLLRNAYNYVTQESVENIKPEAQADKRLKQRVSYDLLFSAIFLLALHGFSAFKVLLILYVNFTLATSLPKPYIPTATWVFNIGVLFLNEIFGGYPYASLARFMQSTNVGWGSWLDSYGGLVPRWEILFNITVLRLVSFNMDYYWSLDRRAGSLVEKKQIDVSSLSERDRVTIPASSDSYTFLNYLSYVLYSPLYLAGPIITFNDYVSQLRHPSPSITQSRTTLYGIRFLVSLLTMELILHYIYVVAISKSNPDWSHYTPFQLSMLGYFNLHIIWLKLLLPWRFFRLWALLDGIDPPENMVRCMSDNYSALAFWRGWHRSFNRWIVRYIFIPLGGSRSASVGTMGSFAEKLAPLRPLGTMLAVFTFVALWHDISLRLLAWSWLIVLFLVPEILCTHVLFPKRAYVNRPTTYRILSGVGAVGNVLMMMAANLVGFALGLDGLKGLLDGIVGSWGGLAFLGTASATLFVGVMVMFEVREMEKRKGIKLSC